MSKSKKGFGKLIAFATIVGAVAAGISYFTKYKSFHKELEEDFHDFEDNDREDVPADQTASRNYVQLNPGKEAKAAAHEAADMVNDAMDDVSDMAEAAAKTVSHTAEQMGEKAGEAAEQIGEKISDSAEAAGKAAADLKDKAQTAFNASTTIIEDEY